MSIKDTKDGVLITIFVKPNSPKFSIELDREEIVVHATEEPERGKVNKEILKEFSKIFHSSTELATGFTSKQKVLLVKNANKTEVEKLLGLSK